MLHYIISKVQQYLSLYVAQVGMEATLRFRPGVHIKMCVKISTSFGFLVIPSSWTVTVPVACISCYDLWPMTLWLTMTMTMTYDYGYYCCLISSELWWWLLCLWLWQAFCRQALCSVLTRKKKPVQSSKRLMSSSSPKFGPARYHGPLNHNQVW